MFSAFYTIRRWSLTTSIVMTIFGAFSNAFAAGPPGTIPEETSFLSENDKAMTTMMDDMSIKPTGNVDQDFVAMMVPHHQGAIDMAQAELRHGHNEQLRRIAQEIVVEQQQEIVAMRLALGQPLPSSAPAADQQTTGSTASPTKSMPPNGMDMTMPMSMPKEQ
ncbi:DUF305 domain-containing protein [Paraburkholderia madseniana]|uniref:DUF305 domain-containing protein n=1 Tax=Paraburkholderia madseniana TaxID=2599607 RepID=A0AAP5BAS4_9BURK|nr:MULTISPECIES: DUF305 domain-containing protein [Paraburkholderia]MCX4146280.1 DUF305 domain-containing protein [Paraburkholderia madseniana]MDN7149226.1 DUF305 domain-containing protein [Paraburkholderia sp. WS6]MDQ6408106.1 DUF305 domain-containing protein [Paraburkholderia madseniana]